MTLIELLIAVAIGAIVLAALNSVVSLGLQAQASGRQQNELVFQGQFALERMITTARNTPSTSSTFPKPLTTPTAGTTGDWFSPVIYNLNSCNQLLETTTGNDAVISTFATVNSATGVVTGVAVGTSVITATYGSTTGSTTLTVTPATPASIAVAPATSSVPINGTQQFTVCATYSDGSTGDVTAAASWTSGTTSVATVNSTTGVVTGLAVGTSVITATSGSTTGSTTLTVNAETLTKIEVTPATTPIPISGTQPFTQQLMVTATYTKGPTRDVTASSSWTSGTPVVATVNASGVATGVGYGTSLITANFGGKTGQTTVTGTTGTDDIPAKLVSIAVTPVTASVPIGGAKKFMATATYRDGSTRVVTPDSWKSFAPSTGPKVIATNVSAFSAQLPVLGIGPVDDGHRPAGTLSLTLDQSAASQPVTLSNFVRLGGGTR